MPEEQMHILFITKWYPSAEDPQMAIFVKRHAEAVSRFAKVTVLHVHSAPVEVDELDIEQSDGITTIRAAWPKTRHPIFKLKRMLNSGRKAANWLEQNQSPVDLIHCHMLARTAWLAQQLFPSVPYIVTEHWTGYVNGKYEELTSLRRWMYKRLAKNAAAMTVVSNQLRKALMKKGFRKDISVIPNVVEVPLLEPEKNDIIQLLIVADFHEKNKNLTGVFRAVARLRKQYMFHLTVIGDGHDAEYLHKLAGELEIIETVNFAGRQPQEVVYQTMAKSDLLLVNSRFETFSMVTLEALMLGVPVIATRCGGPENFVNESNGFLIPTDDQLALENALDSFLSAPDQFDSEKIKESVGNTYNKQSVGSAFFKLYHSILKT